MLNFPFRSSQPEILDDFDLQGHDLTNNLRELERVNTLLGGNSIVREGVAKIISSRGLSSREINIVDAGCGGGDALRLLARWGRKQNFRLKLTGVDANKDAIRYAEQESAKLDNVQFRQLNILSDEFTQLKADIVMFNLFLHHFEEADIVKFLKTCRNNGSSILINDLQRNRVGYHAFRLVSRLLKFSYIGRHDGKLSVKKSFTKKDWQRMMMKAGMTNYELHWRWAFRYLVLVY